MLPISHFTVLLWESIEERVKVLVWGYLPDRITKFISNASHIVNRVIIPKLFVDSNRLLPPLPEYLYEEWLLDDSP